jgi:hypothetical protein
MDGMLSNEYLLELAMRNTDLCLTELLELDNDELLELLGL